MPSRRMTLTEGLHRLAYPVAAVRIIRPLGKALAFRLSAHAGVNANLTLKAVIGRVPVLL